VEFAKDAYLIPYWSASAPIVTNAELAGATPTFVPMSDFDLRHVHWTKSSG
jgi:hypothetical protein